MSKINLDAELMMEAGYAIASIAKLIIENDMRDQDDEGAFLDSYTLGGLATAASLIGHRLSGAGEKIQKAAEGKQ